MSDFGHWYGGGPGIRIDGWGAGPFLITVAGKSLRFEDSDMFGPSLVKLDGEPRKNPWPPERHPFWGAYTAWRQQGRRLADDKVTCIWDPLPPESDLVPTGSFRTNQETGKREYEMVRRGTLSTGELKRRGLR